MEELKERNAELQERLTAAITGSTIDTPTGQLSTANGEVIREYIATLLGQISGLEKKVEVARQEKEEEVENERRTRSAALSQSTVLKEQADAMKEDVRKLKEENEALKEKVKAAQEEGKVGKSNLQSQLKKEIGEKEKAIGKQQKQIEDAEKSMMELKESLRQSKLAVLKRDKLIEMTRTANEKLKKNEGLYKKAIEQLQANLKDREGELEELYRGMKISK